MNKKVKTFLVLALYMAVTVGIYYGVCCAMHRPFTELHLLYGALIGCVAYLPRFVADRKAAKKK